MDNSKTLRVYDTLTSEQSEYVADLIEIAHQLYGRIYDHVTENGTGGQMNAIDEVIALAEEFYEEEDKGTDWEESAKDWTETIDEWCAEKAKRYPVFADKSPKFDKRAAKSELARRIDAMNLACGDCCSSIRKHLFAFLSEQPDRQFAFATEGEDDDPITVTTYNRHGAEEGCVTAIRINKWDSLEIDTDNDRGVDLDCVADLQNTLAEIACRLIINGDNGQG